MPNSKAIARKLFRVMSADLATVCPEIAAEVACPLCLRRFTIEALEDGRLSVEHVIPGALGGNVVTLTCTKCNNTDGTELDRNLVSAMEALDGLEGRGAGLNAVWHNSTGHVAANVDWRVGTGETTGIKIVGKASNAAGIDAIRNQLGDGAEFTLTFNLGFVPERYWRAAFRSAYLAAFERFGYAYVVRNNARLVREVLDGTNAAPETILQAYPEPEPQKQTFIVPIKGKWSGIVVILRLRSAVARYLAVLLPGREWTPLIEMAALHRDLRLNASRHDIKYEFRFGDDPVKVLRKARLPTESAEQ
jgi:hypothetical protein